jgi:hypothetical protein
MYTFVRLIDGPILTSRPIHATGSARPSLRAHINWQLSVSPLISRNSCEEKSPEYHMSTNLTFITIHFHTVKGRSIIRSHLLPLTDEAGTFLFRDRRGQNYLFMTDEAEHSTSLWDPHDKARYLLLEADEALALHHFHSFVLMHIHGDNSNLFGDDNDDHRYSLIRGVLRPNATNVIN